MSDPADILYREAAPFERALAHAAAGDLSVPIRELLDAGRTPLRFLPFKAAHESVDLWFDDWPEERKRRMAKAAEEGIADLIGTRTAAKAFLDFVDTEIVHKRSYPSRAPVGRIAAGLTPINHPDFTARFLLKVALRAPRRAVCVGRTAIGRGCIKPVDREPIRRANRALVVSKNDATAYTATYAHRVPVTLDDGFDLAAGLPLGAHKDRIRL